MELSRITCLSAFWTIINNHIFYVYNTYAFLKVSIFLVIMVCFLLVLRINISSEDKYFL